MICVYLRSSSVNTYNTCPRQYFITYTLGYKSDSKKRTDAGTIAHSILEILAKRKLAKQNNQEFIEDEITGKLSTKFLNVNHLIEQVYKYFTTGPFKNHEWDKEMFDHVKFCVNNALNYEDGKYSPTKREIFKIEQPFDIELPQEWAKYSFETTDGQIMEGQAHLKGTIDLIVKVDNETLEIQDWKSGAARKDWKNNKIKEPADLEKDFQLRLYHYVASKLFPEYKKINVTIFYLKDDPNGGPFTFKYNEGTLISTEKMIKENLQKIISDKRAKAEYSYFFCNKLCDFSKKSLHQLNPAIEEVKAEKKHLFTKPGQTLCACDHVGQVIEDCGVDFATFYLGSPDFDVGTYTAPGGEPRIKNELLST